MEELQMKVLQICSPAIKDMLDISAIVPHLNANNLLTKDNVKMLTNMSKTQQEKTEYLVYILPRKNNGWFEKFLQCLEQSAEVAGHTELVKELTVTLDDMKQINNSKQSLAGECAAANEVAMPHGSGREEIYTILVESHESDHTITVKSSECVSTLLDRIREQQNIVHPIKINVMAGANRLHVRHNRH
ncbi:uncharacterized protein [Dysidea avara]|uniref:uncharacterized protein n=1 Tax=Dysidea avara TaxID=196820 RepID=UPI003323C03D